MRLDELYSGVADRPLYVSRPLLNGTALRRWATRQGFTRCMASKQFHVTLVYSKKPVDHNAIAPDRTDLVVPASIRGRSIETFGKGAVVLGFQSAALQRRWQQLHHTLGCSWDHDNYRPHVTITYEGAPDDLQRVEPFDGELHFGAERFAALDEDWADEVTERDLPSADTKQQALLLGAETSRTAY